MGVAASRQAAEGVGGGAVTGRVTAATEAAIGGFWALAGLEWGNQPRGLQTHQGLGGGVEASKFLIKQLHRLARELGEDVPVHVSTEPREAGAGEETGKDHRISLGFARPSEPLTRATVPLHKQGHFIPAEALITGYINPAKLWLPFINGSTATRTYLQMSH